MKKNFKKISHVTSLSLGLLACTISTAATNANNAVCPSPFAQRTITPLQVSNTVTIGNLMLGGAAFVGQLTWPSVPVFRDDHLKSNVQATQRTSIIRVCFNRTRELANTNVFLPVSAGLTAVTTTFLPPLTVGSQTAIGIDTSTPLSFIVNLLNRIETPDTVDSTPLSIRVYDDRGGHPIADYQPVDGIPANGCLTFNTDDDRDPLFGDIHRPGLYHVIADAPRIEAGIHANIDLSLLVSSEDFDARIGGDFDLGTISGSGVEITTQAVG